MERCLVFYLTNIFQFIIYCFYHRTFSIVKFSVFKFINLTLIDIIIFI